MKKMFAYLLSIIMSCTLTAYTVVNGSDVDMAVDEDSNETVIVSLNIGDYILLGKYSDAPILWRCVDIDENGMLMLSDKLLCEKVIGSTSFWKESTLRKWLNSDVPEGEVEWETYLTVNDNKVDFDRRGSQFNREKGFLHEDNFSLNERAVMKPVTQWTMLPTDHLDLTENGETKRYTAVKGVHRGGPFSEPPAGQYFYDISELPKVYSGAAHRVEDTVFLLDEMQIYRIWSNFGAVNTVFTPELNIPPGDYRNAYRLRTPLNSGAVYCDINFRGKYGSYGGKGIRPAFYLNESNALILSGSGTEDDPYVIDGKNGVGSPLKPEDGIFINGTRLQLDQYPVMENDRVLVPMRKIFESLGASVNWDNDTRTITVVRGGVTITLQIDNQTMTIDGKNIELDVPPRLINNRTLVPIRAVSEGLGAKVEWSDELKQVNITTR